MATKRTTLPRVDIDPALQDYLEGLERDIYALQEALKAQGGSTDDSLIVIRQDITDLTEQLDAKTFPVMPNIPDLDSGTATTTDIADDVNAIKAALRTSGRMGT